MVGSAVQKLVLAVKISLKLFDTDPWLCPVPFMARVRLKSVARVIAWWVAELVAGSVTGSRLSM